MFETNTETVGDLNTEDVKADVQGASMIGKSLNKIIFVVMICALLGEGYGKWEHFARTHARTHAPLSCTAQLSIITKPFVTKQRSL